MKTVKKIMAVLLAVMLIAPATVNAAAPSVTKQSIVGKSTTVTVTYNGQNQLPSTLTIDGKTLVLGKDFVYENANEAKNADTYKLTIIGIGNYEGMASITLTINKAASEAVTSTTVPAKKAYKASKIKKAGKSFSVKVKGATYTVKGKTAKKYIKVSKKGKVTVKKGIKKGTYKIVVKTKATANRKAGKKVVKIVIK